MGHRNEDVCSGIGTPAQGVLALWASVIMQAVRDVGFGLRQGMITADFQVTEMRLEGDDSCCREVLRFLTGARGRELAQMVAEECGGSLSLGFLLDLARAEADKCAPVWTTRRKLTVDEREQRARVTRQYQQEYHQNYRKKGQLSDGGAVVEPLLSDGLGELPGTTANGPQGPSAMAQPLQTSQEGRAA